MKLNLYFTCDSDATCLEFARINHKPRHTSRDMRNRDFVAGKYWCDTHREYHDEGWMSMSVHTRAPRGHGVGSARGSPIPTRR